MLDSSLDYRGAVTQGKDHTRTDIRLDLPGSRSLHKSLQCNFIAKCLRGCMCVYVCIPERATLHSMPLTILFF